MKRYAKRAATVSTMLALALLTPSAHAAGPLPEVAVTTCGQIVPKKTLGYLTGDLDCTGYDGGDPTILYETDVPVTLGQKAKLDLRGFTLTGGGRYTVGCINIRADRKRHGVCEIFNGTLTGGTQYGVLAENAYVHDLTSTGTGVGLYLLGKKVTVENVVVSDNYADGIRLGHATLRNVTVMNNAWNGIAGYKLKVYDSTITGNGTGDYCLANPGNCFDINAQKWRPKVENVVCETSGGSGALGPAEGTWGVCSAD